MPNTSLHTPPEHKMHEGAHLKNLTHPSEHTVVVCNRVYDKVSRPAWLAWGCL